MENPIKWMIWGYHHFRKHPYGSNYLCQEPSSFAKVTPWWIVLLMAILQYMDRPHVAHLVNAVDERDGFTCIYTNILMVALGGPFCGRLMGTLSHHAIKNHEQSCGSNMLAPKKRPSDPHCCLCHHSNHHYTTPLHFEKIDSKPTKHGTFAMKQCWNIDAQGP